MVRLVDRLTEIKNPVRIAEIFDYNLPNEMITALADANDPDVVRAVLGAGWTVRGGTALPQDIRLIQGNRVVSGVGDFIVERAPFIDGIRKSRFFTSMGDAKIVTHGTQEDNRNAVKSIVSYLRTAGVDNDTVDGIANLAFRSFTPGASDVARKQTMDAFYQTLESVMRIDGIPEQSIDELFNVGRRRMDQMRRYLQDRLGMPFDNGYKSYLMNKDREFLPVEDIERIIKELGLEKGGKSAITSPTELVELLDRAIVLPDLREVRRFTRSKLFRDVIGERMGKLPITAKRQTRMVEVITDEKRFDEVTREINDILELPNPVDADYVKLEELQKELASLKAMEPRKIITPDQRFAFEAVDFMQNQLWKPLALATGGYVVRNSLDAQVRMAFSELPSLFTHPFEYINLVLGSSKKMTLRMENLAKVRGRAKPGEVLPEDVLTLDDLREDVREALTFGLRQQGLGASEIDNHLVATGSFDNVNRGMSNGLALHTDAVVQNGRRTQGDPLRKLATQTFVEMGGVNKTSIDIAANRVANVIVKNPAIRRQVDDLHKFGFEITATETGRKVRTPAIDLTVLPEDEQIAAYRQYAYRIVVGNSQILTGAIPEAEFMYAFGYVPKTSGGKMVGAFEQAVDELTVLERPQAGFVGATVQMADDQIGVVTRVSDLSGEFVVDPFDGTVTELKGLVATVQPVFPDKAFDATYGSREARKLIELMPVSDDATRPGLPMVLKRELLMRDERFKTRAQNLEDGMNQATNWFFSRLYGTVTRKLERSPVFREYYYRQVTDLAGRLKPEDAQRFLDDATAKAKKAGVSIDEYVGDKQLIRQLKRTVALGSAKGPKVINPILKQEPGVLFHGTATKLPSGQFGDIFSAVADDANNLFGRGVYLTDSPNVAISYTAKNAASKSKIGNIPFSETGSVYRVRPSSTANLLDLRKPSPELNSVIASLLDNELDELLSSEIDDYVGNELDNLRQLLANGETTGERAFAAFRALFKGGSQEIADTYVQELTLGLRDIADGMIYTGGVRRGGLGQHTAYVFLNEGALEIIDETSPVVSAAARGNDIGLEELDDYAKFVALTRTKELLYDASNRSNLEDVLRVIMPFAPAWKEIMGTYVGFMRANPVNTARSFQRIYTGLQGADPDNDGRGFFYQDPNTDQMMFTFPASGTLAKVLTGLDAPLEAPVKRLSQGIQAFPALGPMGQVAASKILPHLPEAEFFTGLLLPYGLKGPTTAFNPTPQWLQKATQVFTAPTADLETQYANTYIETMRALSASGDYDLSSKDDINQLESDAKFKARILMGFRALSQFVGPTAGATEFKIPTEQGDRFVSQLIKEFYDMQANPDIGYEKAVPEFLRIYGDEAALYVASKTRSVAEGLEATKEFQDWADANAGLVKDYASVANYLAPAGSDFNFAVWSLQLQRGERVRLTDREVVELAQQRIGSAKYRDARRQVGPYPSEAARDALKRYREYLHGKYPGFPAVAEFEVGSFYNDILSLKDLVDDPRSAGNDTAVAIRQYLIARERAIAVSGVSEQGFKTARSAARARAGLESIGISLSEKYPGFSRIFDRLLASEVE
jgi:hypothetical protein